MILNTLSMAHLYKRLPSEILFIEEEYTAYCLNEACAVISGRLKDGELPIITTQKAENYKKPSDVYKKYQ